MDAAVAIDPVVQRYRAALVALYGPVLDRVVLFGFRARGDAGPESDYDLAVFLKHMDNRRVEANRLADLSVRVFDDTGAFVEAKPFRAEEYTKRSPLMHEIRRDGVTL